MAYGSRPSMSQPDARNGRDSGTSQRCSHGWATERGDGHEILGEIVDHAESSPGPVEENQVFAKDVALGSCVLDPLPISCRRHSCAGG